MAGLYPQKCSSCARDPNLRKQWGCDDVCTVGQFRDPQTQEWVYRCPISQTDETSILLVRAWAEYYAGGMGRGPLPFAGGWFDQPWWFWELHNLCGAEYPALQEMMRDNDRSQ